MEDLARVAEAILFVSGDPIEIDTLAHAFNRTYQEMLATLEELREQLAVDERGIQLNISGSSAYLSICPQYAAQVESFLQPLRKQTLSQSVLETLSIIAYRQPVTKQDIEGVRGVKSDYSIQMLLNRGFIEEVGRKEALGRPVLYGTTDAFLAHFGLASLDELPPMGLTQPEEMQT